MQLVRVVNEGDKEFVSRWEGNIFRIKPGSETMVTRDAVNRWTGNADTVNDGKVNARREEYNRLRVLYGAYERDEVWEANRPHLAVYDLDGNRITTVLDDPEGTNINAPQFNPVERSMQEQLAVMEQQMEAMRRAIADREAADATGQGRTEGRPSSIPEPTQERVEGQQVTENEGRREDAEQRGVGGDVDTTYEQSNRSQDEGQGQVATTPTPVPDAPPATEDVPGRVRVGNPNPPKK